jgi:cytochrome c556
MRYSSAVPAPIEEIMAQHRTLLAVFVVAVTASHPAAQQPDPSHRPVAVMENVDLMDLMLKPGYDALREDLAHPPADRKGWAALYQQAARLAEMENLLFFRTRAGETRQAEWESRAAKARDASAAVAAAALLGLRNAQSADFDRVRAAFPAVSEACTACHRAFAREAPVIKP